MSKFTIFDGIRNVEVLEPSRSRAVVEYPDIRAMRHLRPFTKEEFAYLGLIHPQMREQAVVDAFRQLRTSLLSRMRKFNSCLLVTGVSSGAGVSFNALNLAAAFTFDHLKTALLIDCNFNNPVLSDRLKVNAKLGLRDYISGNVEDVSTIVYPTGVPRLRLVPCGNSETDIVEFFTGARMQDFLEEVRNRYPDRVIIIDAPPILESADTKILAEICDHVLLILKYKGATPSTVDRCLATIDRSKYIGMVLNN